MERKQFWYVFIVSIRLILAAQQAKDLAASINPDTAASNPQLLADQGNEKIKSYNCSFIRLFLVSELAGHAQGLSDYLKDKANGLLLSSSPWY